MKLIYRPGFYLTWYLECCLVYLDPFLLRLVVLMIDLEGGDVMMALLVRKLYPKVFLLFLFIRQLDFILHIHHEQIRNPRNGYSTVSFLLILLLLQTMKNI